MGQSLERLKTISIVNDDQPVQKWQQGVDAVVNYIKKTRSARVEYSDTASSFKPFLIYMPFQSVGEWVNMQKTLSSDPDITSWQVKSLKKDHAYVALSLKTSLDVFRSNLKRQNIQLRQRSNAPSSLFGGSYIVYEIERSSVGSVEIEALPKVSTSFENHERALPAAEILIPSQGVNRETSGRAYVPRAQHTTGQQEWNNRYAKP